MKGHLRSLTLKYLSEEQELSGAAIVKIIKENTGWEPSPGTLYPLLDKLREEELINVEKDGRANKYSITDEGCKYLEEFAKEQYEYWDRIIQSMKAHREIFGDEELEDMITQLEMLRDGKPFPYPQLVSYDMINVLQDYESQDQETQEKLNELLDETFEKVKQLVEE